MMRILIAPAILLLSWNAYAKETLGCGPLMSYEIVTIDENDNGTVLRTPALSVTFKEVTPVVVDDQGKITYQLNIGIKYGPVYYILKNYDLERQIRVLTAVAEVFASPIVCLSMIDHELNLRSGQILDDPLVLSTPINP